MATLNPLYTMKQAGSRHEANLEHTSCTCILNTFASCLLHRVNGVLVTRCAMLYLTLSRRRRKISVSISNDLIEIQKKYRGKIYRLHNDTWCIILSILKFELLFSL